MAEITKKDIKNAVIDALEPFAKANEDAHDAIIKANEDAHDAIIKANEDAHDAIIKANEDAHNETRKELAEMKRASNRVLSSLDKFFKDFETHWQEHTFLGGQIRRLEERIEKLEAKKSR